MVVSASKEVRDLISSKNTFSVINDNETPLSQFVLNPDFISNSSLNKRLIQNNCSTPKFLNTSEIAESIFGNNIYSNIFQVGYAFQKGLIPINAQSFIKALKLNNIKVNENINAFNWGRIAADDIKFLLNKLNMKYNVKKKLNVDELINFKYEELISYQNKKYADTYLRKVVNIRKKLQKLKIKDDTFIESVANSLYKTMAYKDEYEVGRLFTDGRFQKDLSNNFKSYDKIYLHLSPPF